MALSPQQKKTFDAIVQSAGGIKRFDFYDVGYIGGVEGSVVRPHGGGGDIFPVIDYFIDDADVKPILDALKEAANRIISGAPTD